MKKVLIPILVSVFSILTLRADIPLPHWHVTANIIGVDGCCFTVRVDLHFDFEDYSMIIASSTVKLGEEGCCPTEQNGIIVSDDTYPEDFFNYYGVYAEITQAVDDLLAGILPSSNKTSYLDLVDYSGNIVDIYPNPNRENLINLQFKFDAAQEVSISVRNAFGQLIQIYKPTIVKDDMLVLSLPLNTPIGNYTIHILKNDGTSIVKKLAVQ